jgi:hypothetical protein
MVGIYTPHCDVKKKLEHQCALKRRGAIAGALRCAGTETKQAWNCVAVLA